MLHHLKDKVRRAITPVKTPLTSCFDGAFHGITEGLEELAVWAVRAILRVPLHGEHETIARQFQRLWYVIGCPCDNHELTRHPVHALMVAGIHDVFVRSQDGFKLALGGDRNRVSHQHPGAEVSLNVLDQGSSEKRIQELHAAANRQNREAAVQRLS
jgi:hypothetical protein